MPASSRLLRRKCLRTWFRLLRSPHSTAIFTGANRGKQSRQPASFSQKKTKETKHPENTAVRQPFVLFVTFCNNSNGGVALLLSAPSCEK